MSQEKKSPENQKPRKKPPRKPKDSPTAEDDVCPALETALTSFLKQHVESKNKSIKDLKSLESLLNQYLNSFILLGYSRDTREMVTLVSAKTEQSADSLSTALNKFLIKNTKNPPFPGV